MPDLDAVVHELPMRWADLDQLNHVNNVVYVDYAAEVRAKLGPGVADAPVRSTTVRYLRPMLLSRRPVVVVSTLEGDMLSQDVCAGHGDARRVFAHVETVLGPPEPITPHTPQHQALPSSIRRSDLDVDGAVSTVALFELFQEGRILFLSTQLESQSAGRFVVGTVRVDQAHPVRWRSAPYDVRSRVSRVGNGSLTIETELSDAEAVLARATTVLVGFDLASQRSRPFDDAERRMLEALLAP